MPLPLLWIGAAVLGAVAAKELEQKRKKQDHLRENSDQITTRGSVHKHDSGIAKYPTEVFSTETLAIVRPGALVCCGLSGVLEHTGILIDEDTIVELHGSGLIKAISPSRFLAERSGKDIFVACDSTGEAICDDITAQRAITQIYDYQDYDLIKNNCHRFVWQCISGLREPLTTFHQLNKLLSKRYDRKIYWDKWDRL
ncbi:hypothetical protein [Thalassotalea sp. ND16A]|uniref:hypothetical protein n=1 Tax=Thalassotalea sp. ND16A TaxID=1535422 RepID=UPI00051A7D2B|nr:hypothetical protein [Thalassotalea sp. ND16A]KGJ93496.1 hypothetical protein ND16A_1471 [Thalassotalea sp. ND16A]